MTEFDLSANLQECKQQAPVAGDPGDGKAETTCLFQGGVVGTFSAPAGRAKSETICSSYGGAVDASSAPARRAESDLSAASISDTDQGNGQDFAAVLSGRPLGTPPATVRGLIRGQSQCVEGEEPADHQPRMNFEVVEALLAAAHE